jgi:hypothetical protein
VFVIFIANIFSDLVYYVPDRDYLMTSLCGFSFFVCFFGLVG